MSNRPEHRALRGRPTGPGSAPLSTRLHGRLALQVFAFSAAAAVMLVSVVAPDSPQSAVADSPEVRTTSADVTQSLTVEEGSGFQQLTRDSYKALAYVPPVVAASSAGAPAAGVPDPGTAQAIAFEMVTARGWGQGEFDCLVALWKKESGWNTFAHNKSSGAYGIPQSLPGSKMASAGADWATNPATQITWGLGYIQGRYSTPCGAWSASQTKGWY